MNQDSIYQQGIKQLAAAEHGAGSLADAHRSVTVDNPLCGDRLTLAVKMRGDLILEVAQTVRGCLLCRASASVIGLAAAGCNAQQITTIQAQLIGMLKGEQDPDWPTDWQALALFKPVQAHKSRYGCVLLPFQALHRSLTAIDQMD